MVCGKPIEHSILQNILSIQIRVARAEFICHDTVQRTVDLLQCLLHSLVKDIHLRRAFNCIYSTKWFYIQNKVKRRNHFIVLDDPYLSRILSNLRNALCSQVCQNCISVYCGGIIYRMPRRLFDKICCSCLRRNHEIRDLKQD